MATSSRDEFVVRVPKRVDAKKYSLMRFNGALSVNAQTWSDPGSVVRLEREDNRAAMNEIKQEYGAGSEYGKAARDEARRKKYGRQLRLYHHDKQPWQLALRDADGKERKFRSIRESGASEHADYWVFLKSGEKQFDAVKLDDWYQFLPTNAHRTLDIDQAEERFLERSRVMNQFALKTQIQRQLKAKDEDGGEQMIETKSRGLKIKDEASSDEDELSDTDNRIRDADAEPSTSTSSKKNRASKNQGKMDGKNKKAKKNTQRKDKKLRVENADEIAAYESEDGEDEGREYDYMSDSGTDSDRDNVPMEEKVEKALVGVGDEHGLKRMIEDSDYDSDSDSDSGDDATKKLIKGGKSAGEGGENDDEDDLVRKRRMIDIDERDSSGSDSDDPDKDKIDSVVFMPKKSTAGDDDAETIAMVNAESTLALNRKRAGDADDGNEAKKIKMEESSTEPEGLTEETVRKYLRRKPHTTKELLAKVKSRCVGMTKPEIVTKLAAILKRIEPQQTKQMVGKKQVLYFSLSNREA